RHVVVTDEDARRLDEFVGECGCVAGCGFHEGQFTGNGEMVNVQWSIPLPLGEGARRAGEGSKATANKPSPGASRRPLPEGEGFPRPQSRLHSGRKLQYVVHEAVRV